MLSLCLSISSAPGAAKKINPLRTIVQLDDSSTVEDLFQKAEESSGSKNISVKVGFPPKDLARTKDTTLKGSGIQNQERITIIVNAGKPSAKKGTTKKGGSKRAAAKQAQDDAAAAATTTSSPANKRSRRAAAQKAAESFPDVIRAQEKMEREAAKSSSSRSSSRAGRRIGNTNASQRPKSSPMRFKAASTTGRRLQDGATIAASRAGARKRKQQSESNDGNTNDPSLALLDTLESQSNAGRLMRKGWRQAVNDRYEQNKAVARIAAIPHSIQFELVQNGSSLTDARLKVTFPKGVQGRGNYEESVDYLPRNVLEQVVGSIYPGNPESLRSENLALLSPRVLWSLMYHEKEKGSVEDALISLQPSLDWSFLRRRKKELSAKAKENLRQEEEAKNSGSNTVSENWEAAAAAIASVEQAMERIEELDQNNRQARMLHAAELRQSQQEGENDWKIETPSETDEDELLECVKENLPAIGSADKIVRRLIDECAIHNWRELANSSADDVAKELGVDHSCVQSWLARARQESVDEVIVEVCDNNVDAVSLLTEHAQTGTPLDLANWSSIPGELEKMLTENVASSNGSTKEIPSSVLLQKWCSQAQLALEKFSWLNSFTTPLPAIT